MMIQFGGNCVGVPNMNVDKVNFLNEIGTYHTHNYIFSNHTQYKAEYL